MKQQTGKEEEIDSYDEEADAAVREVASRGALFP